LRFAETFKEMQIPSTLDGELPSKAFGEKGVPILIGERYLVQDEQGREVAGELVSAVMMESENSVMATMRLNDGIHINVSMPVSEQELDIYRESPQTFFGVYEPAAKVEHPVDMYEFILSVYKDTPRERLLEFMADHPHVDQFRSLPQSELAKIFAEAVAQKHVSSRTSADERTPAGRGEGVDPEE
jgi:hypothetical protein